MSEKQPMPNGNIHYLICPLCHGRGHSIKPAVVQGDNNQLTITSVSYPCHFCYGKKSIAVTYPYGGQTDVVSRS